MVALTRVGTFRFLLADHRWEWSPDVERMHGYGPGEAVPTTELVLSHEHPDEHGQLAATMVDFVCGGTAFSAQHRIVDVQGRVHDVVVVGDTVHDEQGEQVGVQGYYVDLTASPDGAVAEITDAHRRIEQAKGMLMLVYRIDAQSAIDLLKWRSQASDVALSAIAGQIVGDFLGLPYSEVLPPRSSYDQLLLTAHERIDGVATEQESVS